jgi:hypothetical protein
MMRSWLSGTVAAVVLLGQLSVAGASAPAKFSTKIPPRLAQIVRAQTDIRGRVRLSGATRGDGRWAITANHGRGAGEQSQTFTVLTNGKILDKTSIEVEPRHTGDNNDL